MGLPFSLERVSALVVDDNHHMRVILRTMLFGFGLSNIREASDGAEALEMLKTWPCQIVFCDMKMEPLDGIEMTRLLRTSADSPAPFVPVIMITAYSDRSTVMAARDSGVNEFIAKPLTGKTLYQRIAKVVSDTRLWVKSPNYTGPDRRRSIPENYQGPFRRKADHEAVIADDESDALVRLSNIADKYGAPG